MKSSTLYLITCAVSLGGLLFGFDSGVISGCEEAIQLEFGLSPFWHGLVVAGALIGTVFGALAAGRMCDRFGRKPTLVWMGVLFLVSAAGCALTPGGGAGPHVLGWMRFVGGIAIGGVSVAVPMYIAEIAPPEKRGRLVLVNQFCIVLGIVVSYVSNYCVALWLHASSEVVWRTMLGAECLPVLLYHLVHPPPCKLLGGCLQIANEDLQQMYIVVCLTLSHMEELHAAAHQLFGRRAGIASPVAAQLAQPLHAQDGVLRHHLQAELAAVHWQILSVLVNVDGNTHISISRVIRRR